MTAYCKTFFYPNLLIIFFKLTSWLKPEFCIQVSDLFINLPYKFSTNSLKETDKDRKITENEHLTPTDVYPQFKVKIHKTLWEICIYFCLCFTPSKQNSMLSLFYYMDKKKKKKKGNWEQFRKTQSIQRTNHSLALWRGFFFF